MWGTKLLSMFINTSLTTCIFSLTVLKINLDVKIKSVEEDEWFVKWFVNNLSILCSQCNDIKFFSNIFTSIKRIALWTFSIEISSNYWNCWIETINVVHKNVEGITKGLKLFLILARRRRKITFSKQNNSYKCSY